jgi:two-component system, sensor histidine kinase RpfC
VRYIELKAFGASLAPPALQPGELMDSVDGPDTTGAQVRARVGVVDDDPISTTLQEHLVSLLGHKAIVEAHPQRAVERAMAGDFDLLLLDLNMPEMNGFEALRQLRDREAAHGRVPIPVIAVTGYASESDRLRCLMAGFAEQVSKPIQVESLDLALRRTLSRRAQVSGVLTDLTSDAERLRATVRRLADVRSPERGFGPTIMERFALRSQQLIEAIRQAIFDHDADQVANNARFLKADAEFLGVSRLANMCVWLEELMASQGWNSAEEALLEIEHEHQVVLTVLFESAR